ncbi:MAG: hypothetical protein ABI233_04965 [Chthoniobacterales bacterium]
MKLTAINRRESWCKFSARELTIATSSDIAPSKLATQPARFSLSVFQFAGIPTQPALSFVFQSARARSKARSASCEHRPNELPSK